MLSYSELIDWGTRRCRSVASAMRPTTRSFTLRELLDSLELSRNLASPPHLRRLIALVKEDLAISARFPERSGGPDARRSLGAWRARYNHLDRYLLKGAGRATCNPDDTSSRALSAAEYEGWPLPNVGERNGQRVVKRH